MANVSLNIRPEFKQIAEQIKEGSRVLDLGCGDGSLLAYLQQTRKVSGYGVDRDDDNISACLDNGVHVIQSNLESGLSMFESDSFDYVILSHTIQAMKDVEGILKEMSRVGKECIVSFPNFGFWDNRRQLILGRMPVSDLIPYQWYDTPNIHFCTVKDFHRLCTQLGFHVQDVRPLHNGERVPFLANLLASLAIFRFTK
ncbi:methionine biosynthesis protein MetW [Leeia sp. TBRC 13508]|uniref:Methionine biosynthesis protein MetW n=2 Tax=Leeia speluncae TaxID=2884804 RepID=A0ABS8D563_9NEIS|nr:methionine biosynthesis protein MetW [Leeia speluncae]